MAARVQSPDKVCSGKAPTTPDGYEPQLVPNQTAKEKKMVVVTIAQKWINLGEMGMSPRKRTVSPEGPKYARQRKGRIQDPLYKAIQKGDVRQITTVMQNNPDAIFDFEFEVNEPVSVTAIAAGSNRHVLKTLIEGRHSVT